MLDVIRGLRKQCGIHSFNIKYYYVERGVGLRDAVGYAFTNALELSFQLLFRDCVSAIGSHNVRRYALSRASSMPSFFTLVCTFRFSGTSVARKYLTEEKKGR